MLKESNFDINGVFEIYKLNPKTRSNFTPFIYYWRSIVLKSSGFSDVFWQILPQLTKLVSFLGLEGKIYSD